MAGQYACTDDVACSLWCRPRRQRGRRGRRDDLKVESYVLPVGAATPSLKDVASGQGVQQLRGLAAKAEPGVGLARETVGPAASYAPISRRASGTVPASEAAVARAGLTAPQPARTMTLEDEGAGATTRNSS